MGSMEKGRVDVQAILKALMVSTKPLLLLTSGRLLKKARN